MRVRLNSAFVLTECVWQFPVIGTVGILLLL